MSKFIKVTIEDCNEQVWIKSESVTKVFRNDDGSVIYADSEMYKAKESPEQIEAQLLRDELAMRALSSMDFTDMSYDLTSEIVYKTADAMLKERMK